MTLTCECGYRTPEGASDAKVRDTFNRHVCAPRDDQGRLLTEAVCAECGQTRAVRRGTIGRCCRPCADRLSQTWQNDLDEIAVDRLLSGSPVRSTRAEREAAVTYLTGHGMSARTIAGRTRMSVRTVVRLRNRRSA